ncbi:hypothetical protein M1B34_11635 [Pseudomonas sp. MAFF 302030]|uniref:Uncharacterized protein n=1 Tax=Pseudomonas morbosilactucae TaxID=2938197 RepID=A0A9X1YUC0_9PSED|nr:hypothetical protein [Pseudomonas morbosilactucae]MCK9798358.1 hypothetical protein [Pseudomonas morbosilactucae]
MPISTKIDAKDFYKNLPTIGHETGDIWYGIPSFGMLNKNFVSAVVITPACDLSQNKSETVTILPIVSIFDYLHSKSFYGDVWNEFYSTLKQYGADDFLPKSKFSHPPKEKLEEVMQKIEGIKATANLYEKLKIYVEYINYTELPANDRKAITKPDLLKIFSPKKYDEILKKIFTNSYKSDIHFFPALLNAGEFSAISAHSVALFRYAYSIPVEILDAAQISSQEWWPKDCNDLSKEFPIISNFHNWPIKLSALKDDFLSDLLSRYLSMFMRLGSRDFTTHTINQFITEVKGGVTCI